MTLTMGSLFDGIGGFPLAAARFGIKTVWASEIELFPMEVTKRRFPGMAHKGDITKLSGKLLFPVDIICGGSPCQDLSVAGARAGLAGARSGLFMEQIRIIKEMRTAERERGRTGADIRPRFMAWENVPGAFSSGITQGGGLSHRAGGDPAHPLRRRVGAPLFPIFLAGCGRDPGRQFLLPGLALPGRPVLGRRSAEKADLPGG